MKLLVVSSQEAGSKDLRSTDSATISHRRFCDSALTRSVQGDTCVETAGIVISESACMRAFLLACRNPNERTNESLETTMKFETQVDTP